MATYVVQDENDNIIVSVEASAMIANRSWVFQNYDENFEKTLVVAAVEPKRGWKVTCDRD